MRVSKRRKVKRIVPEKWKVLSKKSSKALYKKLDKEFFFEQETGKIYERFMTCLFKEAAFFDSGKERFCLYVDGELYSRANLNWLFFTKTWPARKLIHKNGNHLDDRFENLEVK